MSEEQAHYGRAVPKLMGLAPETMLMPRYSHLRDYFAAHAGDPPLSAEEDEYMKAHKMGQVELERYVAAVKARWRYAVADAMLAERERKR